MIPKKDTIQTDRVAMRLSAPNQWCFLTLHRMSFVSIYLDFQLTTTLPACTYTELIDWVFIHFVVHYEYSIKFTLIFLYMQLFLILFDLTLFWYRLSKYKGT